MGSTDTINQSSQLAKQRRGRNRVFVLVLVDVAPASYDASAITNRFGYKLAENWRKFRQA